MDSTINNNSANNNTKNTVSNNKPGATDFGLPQKNFQTMLPQNRRPKSLIYVLIAVAVIIAIGSVWYFMHKSEEADPKDLHVHEQIDEDSADDTQSANHNVHNGSDGLQDKQSKEAKTDSTSSREIQKQQKQNPSKGKQDSSLPSVTQGLDFSGELRSETIGSKDNKVFVPADNPQEKGVITKIASPKNKYYVVAGTFLDAYMALDYADLLVKGGVSVYLLEATQDDV